MNDRKPKPTKQEVGSVAEKELRACGLRFVPQSLTEHQIAFWRKHFQGNLI